MTINQLRKIATAHGMKIYRNKYGGCAGFILVDMETGEVLSSVFATLKEIKSLLEKM